MIQARRSGETHILKAIGKEAAKAGLKAWAVGGFVRDLYLGKKTFDIDICAEGPVKPLVDFCVKQYGARAVYFNDFGTARAVFKNGIKLDFVTCRKEVYTKPAALPKVSPSDLKEDLLRRDFTANAWALSILPAEFFKSYDLYGSRADIDKKLVKILHDKSFVDDPTRIFRALRFAARFNWRLEKSTEVLLRKAVKEDYIKLLSRERIRQELIKILQEKYPQKTFKLMDKYEVTKFIYPRLKCPAFKEAFTLPLQLAALAFKLGESGGDFLKSLHLERVVYNEAFALFSFCINKEALQKPLSAAHKKIVLLCLPKISPYALRPLFINAADVQAAGYSGKDISLQLKKAAAAQFSGKIRNKKQALLLIKK